MRPKRSGSRQLFVVLIAALLLFYVGLAFWFTRGIISGRSPITTALHPPTQVAAPRDSVVLPSVPGPENPRGRAAAEDVPREPAGGYVNRAAAPEQPKRALDPNDDIHVVFSTGCNYFQHWQAEVLLHSHLKVGQRGQITRVRLLGFQINAAVAMHRGGIAQRGAARKLARRLLRTTPSRRNLR